MLYRNISLFPTSQHKNFVICVSGKGNAKRFTCMISNTIVDLNSLSAGAQCFPLYWYEENAENADILGLFASDSKEKYVRKDGVSDWIWEEARKRYGAKVTKEDIFYYVYGLLHSPQYREQFANELKKSLPKIPLVEKAEDFKTFSDAGRDLAELHLNYETGSPCPGVTVDGDRVIDDEYRFYSVNKMRFPAKGQKETIIYNDHITIRNIPAEAYEYVVNGRSAVEWVMENYQDYTDKDSQIRNDPNDWSREHGKPRYILDLLLSVINLSVKTMKIVKSLPELTFPEAEEAEQ
jgi:predicted helicase